MRKGWEIKRLPEIADYSIGLTYSPKDVSDRGTIVLRSSNVQEDKLDLTDLVRVTRTVKDTLKVRRGDILMCSRNGSKRLVGKTAVIGDLPEEMTFGTFMTVIRSEHSPYLGWFFRSEAFREQIGVGENTMINQITKYMLDVIRVPMPPPDEQQRIVGLLDEAFEGIATAKAIAEKNLQNARALFESHLQSVFNQGKPGWIEKPLGDFCSFENGDRGTNYPSKSARTATGIPFINAGHLTDDGIDLETMDYIPRERFDLLSNGKIRKGDILFCLRGSLGKFASVGNLSEGAIASSLVIVRPDKTVLNDYLVAYFRSPLCAAMINRFKNGAAQPNLSAQSLRNFIAPVPSPVEQELIIAKLTDLREQTQRIALIYEQKLAALDALKKSLLHQAFTGQL